MITTLGSAVGFMIVMAKPSESQWFGHHDLIGIGFVRRIVTKSIPILLE